MTRKEEIIKAAHKYILSDAVKVGNEKLAFGDFINGAEWADKTMLDKVCKYLYRKLENGKVFSSQLIDNLREEMEE